MVDGLELPVDPVYISMLERIEEERDGNTRNDLARVVEGVIHDNYQQIVSDTDDESDGSK